MLIATMRLAIGNALRDGSPRYAAATYALSEALFLQRQQQGSKGHLPKMLYFPCGTTRLFRSLFHERSTSDDPAWAHLENPDRTGFCGITSCSPVICNGFPDWFSVSGCCVDDNGPDGVTYDPVDSDVVGFESAADDENGCHSAIILEDDEHGAFPPNTLFRLKRVIEAGFWEAPGGIFPEQRLLIVTATYRAPRAGLSVVSGVGGKMCEPATSLQYGLRSAYIAGLDDILARPALTLEHELSRKITWTDWKGVKYNMKSRSSITCAHPPAPRVRPLAHAMLTTKVRRRISSWRRLTNSSESGVKHYPRQTKGDCCPRNMRI